MAVYGYEIGSTITTTNLEELSTPVNPPRSRYYEASVFNNRGDGHVSAHGFPYAIWSFDILTESMLAQLRSFCPGTSATVYIVTRVPPYAAYPTERWAKFRGIMVWPSREQMEKRHQNGRYLGMEFTFRHLEEV